MRHKFFRIRIDWEILIVTAFVSLYTLAAVLVSVHRYWQFDAFWYDFGIFDETVWRLSKFQLPVIPQLDPPFGKIVWGDHFNPTISLLAPLYWITDRAEIILISQVVNVSLAAMIGYRLARIFLKQTLVRIALVFSFLGFVGMQNALYTDVHNIVFATLPFMATLWALFTKHRRLYWVFLILTLGIQENIAAIGVGLGIYLIFKKDREIKRGIATLALSAVWAVVATKWLMPALSGHAYDYQPEFPLVWHEWLTRLFWTLDMKGKTIFVSYATFGLLPIFSLSTLPLVIEHFVERFVLNPAATRWDLGFHYNAPLSFIMFLGSFEILRQWQNHPRIKKLLPYWALATIAGVIFLHRFYLYGPLMLAIHPVFYAQTERFGFMRDFMEKIPADKLVMTQNNIAAHLTHQKVVLLSQNYKKINPEVIAIDMRDGQNANNFFPLPQSKVNQLIASVSADPQYKLKSFGEQLLFERID